MAAPPGRDGLLQVFVQCDRIECGASSFLPFFGYGSCTLSGETQQANIRASNDSHRDINDSDLVQVIIRRRDQSCHLCGIISLKGSNTEPPIEVSVAKFPRPPDGCSFLQDRVAPELGNGSHKTPPWFVTVYGGCDLIFGTGRSLPVQTLTNNVSSRSKSTNTAFDSSTRNSRHKRASSIVSLAQATEK